MTTTDIPVNLTGNPLPAPAARRRSRGQWVDRIVHRLAAGSGVIVLLMMAALVSVLFYAAAPSIKTFGLKFFTETSWRPNALEKIKRTPEGKIIRDADGEAVVDTIPPVFGALPVIYGTAVSSAIALLFAVPMSLGTAMFLIRIAPAKLAGPVSFLVEFLAAIPSIAFGLWGLFVLAPFLQSHVEPSLNAGFGAIPGLRWLHYDGMPTGRDMLAGGLVLGIMVLPIITAVSRDVLRAVPQTQIEGTLALGATWWQSCREMLRYSRSGLFGAVMLGLARAAGETMAVTMVIGNVNQVVASPLAPAQTMASLLANQFAEADGGLHRSALLQVALILLLMSLAFNVVARALVVGKQPTVTQ
ncbi:MAG: phosphate transport system permease protein [Phycisphaerales bacterium]|jgi:phosphate transport system permease protein|nr:phosphate transport system permease protein [Phycisphaerales bacterium]